MANDLVDNYHQQLQLRLANYNATRQRQTVEQDALQAAQTNLEDVSKAHAITLTVAQRVQEIAHQEISRIVSRCLEAVFDDPYEFRIKFEQKRGRTEAELIFLRDGEEIDPMSAAGGGVVDVTAFALRLACLVLQRPPLRKLLILDEPFRFVSAEYQPRIRQLLENLSEELDTQIVLVTHIDTLRCGKVVEL